MSRLTVAVKVTMEVVAQVAAQVAALGEPYEPYAKKIDADGVDGA